MSKHTKNVPPQEIQVDTGKGLRSCRLCRPAQRRHRLFANCPVGRRRDLAHYAAATFVSANGSLELPAQEFCRPEELALLTVWPGHDADSRASFASLSALATREGRLVTEKPRALALGNRGDEGRWTGKLKNIYLAALDLEAARDAVCGALHRAAGLRNDQGRIRVPNDRFQEVTEFCQGVDSDLVVESLEALVPQLWHSLPTDNPYLGEILVPLLQPPAAARAAKAVLLPRTDLDDPDPAPVITSRFQTTSAWLVAAAQEHPSDEALADHLLNTLGSDYREFNEKLLARLFDDYEGMGLLPAYLTPPHLVAQSEVYLDVRALRELVVYNRGQYLSSDLPTDLRLADPDRSRIWVWKVGHPVESVELSVTTPLAELALWAEVTPVPDVLPFPGAKIVHVAPNPA